VLVKCKQFLLLIIHRRITHIVKSGKSLVGERGKNKIYVKWKEPLPSEIWIFRNGHIDRDDYNLGAT
jgi:hypothetical protein